MEAPISRSHHEVVVVNKREAFLFGGFSSSKKLLLNDLWRMDASRVAFDGKGSELAGLVW